MVVLSLGGLYDEVPLYIEVAILLVMPEADAAGVVPSLLMRFSATDATAAASRYAARPQACSSTA